MPIKLWLKSYGKSHRGKIHHHNDDSFAIQNNIFMITDGIGGLRQGDVASKITIKEMIDYFDKQESLSRLNNTSNNFCSLIRAAIQKANTQIVKYSQTKNKGEKMGCTLVLALWEKSNNLHIANIGDARAYLYRKKEIQQISHDHSLVDEMITRGVITKEQAREHPQRNLLTRAVGIESIASPYYTCLSLENQDIVILCSDGLWNMLLDDEIKMILKKFKQPKKICEKLIESANHAGGLDNITVIIIKALAKS